MVGAGSAMKPKIILCLVVLLFVLPAVSLTAPRCLAMPVAAEPVTGNSNVKSLFCAFGGIGMTPIHPPPGFESEFAVVVVEINSPNETTNVAVSDFVLFDQAGKATKFKRVVEVEEFDRPRVATEGVDAYYLNPGGTRPWNGTLPAGKIRLRIRVALTEDPIAPVRFRLTLGKYVIEGSVNGGEWPT
jgi:hypothetical protein